MFGSLKGVNGDGLTAHYMPEAAEGRTGYNEYHRPGRLAADIWWLTERIARSVVSACSSLLDQTA